MFLAIRDGIVAETSNNIESLLKLDKSKHEVIEWHGPLPPYDPELGEPRFDPRNATQKSQDAKERYKSRRLRDYPTIRKQLDMMYWDAVNGTTTWVDKITQIKDKYPKPAE